MASIRRTAPSCVVAQGSCPTDSELPVTGPKRLPGAENISNKPTSSAGSRFDRFVGSINREVISQLPRLLLEASYIAFGAILPERFVD